MKNWIMRNRFVLGILSALGMVATLAAVNGVFNSVNSVTGYQVNATSYALPSALCSVGTANRFNSGCPLPLYAAGTPTGTGAACTPLNVNQQYYDSSNNYAYWICKHVSGITYSWTGPFGGASSTVFYQTVTGFPQEPALTFGSGFTVSDSAGVATVVNLTNSLAVARTCNANGCYDISSTGTIHQWGHVSTPVDGAPGNNVCLPHTFPNNFDKAVITDDFAAGATGTPSVAALTPSGSASPFPCANGGFLVRQTRASNGVYWDATGN